jgi:hypothetical protein
MERIAGLDVLARPKAQHPSFRRQYLGTCGRASLSFCGGRVRREMGWLACSPASSPRSACCARDLCRLILAHGNPAGREALDGRADGHGTFPKMGWTRSRAGTQIRPAPSAALGVTLYRVSQAGQQSRTRCTSRDGKSAAKSRSRTEHCPSFQARLSGFYPHPQDVGCFQAPE